jgi:Host cell surface-exposed lipoprotein/Histidine kinase-like ATPase domain
MRPWPLFAALGPVGALPTAPGLARVFTVTFLGSWDMACVNDLPDVSPLIVSELTTNIVNAATDGDGSPVYQAGGRLIEMRLRLMSDRARLRIEVWDNLPPSAGVPVLRHPARDQEHGRGLALVGRLNEWANWLWGQGFSRAELIQQLTSNYGAGFTQAQAEYAVSKVGL